MKAKVVKNGEGYEFENGVLAVKTQCFINVFWRRLFCVCFEDSRFGYLMLGALPNTTKIPTNDSREGLLTEEEEIRCVTNGF
jgi:hypothetical protein